jgi:putative membrane protein
MANLVIHWLIFSLAIGLTAYLLPGVRLAGIGPALMAALVLGFINAFIRPLLVLLTLPITIVTLGFFILVLNALLIMLTSALIPGFSVRNFWWALLFGILLFFVHSFLNLVF